MLRDPACFKTHESPALLLGRDVQSGDNAGLPRRPSDAEYQVL